MTPHQQQALPGRPRLLSRIWALRDSPNRLFRAAWWTGVLALSVLLLWREPLATVVLVVAGLVNVFFAGILFLWCLTRLPRLLAAGPAVFRWSFWLSLAGTLIAAAAIPTWSAQSSGIEISPSLVLLGALPVFVVLTVLTTAGGWVAAAIGCWAARDSPSPVAGERTAVSVSWLALLGALFIFSRTADLVSPRYWVGIWFALPWLTLFWSRRLLPDGERSAGPAPVVAMSRLLERAAVWRIGRSGKTLDLRGATLGLLSAGLAILLGPGAILTPLRAQALDGLLSFRNEPLLSGPVSVDWSDLRETAGLDRLVLVEMDSAAQRAAASGSEAAVQASLIRKLAAWKPLRIVLPVPRPESSALEGEDRSGAARPSGNAETEHAGQGVSELTAAVREAGNVLVGVPDFARRETARAGDLGAGKLPGRVTMLNDAARKLAAELARAGGEPGRLDVEWFLSPRVPAVRVGGEAAVTTGPASVLPSAAVLLFEALRGKKATPQPPPEGDAVRVADLSVPVVAPGLALIDYYGGDTGRDFARVSSSALLAGQSLFIQPPAPKGKMEGPPPGQWTRPETFFPGKIVILEAFGERPRETPVGALSPSELLADAVVTLTSGDTIRPVPALPSALAILLVCALVGQWSAGVSPLAAAWRAGLALSGVLIAAPLLFMLQGTWADPVVPLVGLTATFTLVTQLTFSIEQEEHRRHRSLLERFVAPQIVEALLPVVDTMKLGGDRRRVCVLFADVRGFTGFVESHSAEEVVRTMNLYLDAVTGALFEHEGILDKYTGDGLVAFFDVNGGPKQDVARAVRAALAMQDAAARVSGLLEVEGRKALGIGIGVHYGEAIVGLVGSEKQFNYTTMGHVVVVSARLQSLARGGEVIVSDSVHLTIEGAFHSEEQEPVHVKGISQPVRPYRVLSAVPME